MLIRIKSKTGEIIETEGFLSSGLTDKNRREIFEGDSVRLYYKGQFHVCKVIFYAGMFCLKWPDGYVNQYQLHPSSLEVVEE